MRAGRRIAAVAAAVVVAAGLVACTNDDNGWDDEQAAAYVGEVEITEAELDEVVGDLEAELGVEIERELARLADEDELDEPSLAAHRERRYGELAEQVARTRTRVLEMRILTEAAERYAAGVALAVPEPALAHQAHELGLAEDNRYVVVVAEFFAVMAVLQSTTEPAQPSEADQREVYDNLVTAGLTSAPFEEAQEVLTAELMGTQVGLRNLLREALADGQVRVNPRYDLVYRVPVPVGSGESWLALPLDGSGDAD